MGDGSPQRARIALALVACAIVAGSETLPWIVTGIGPAGSTYEGFQIWPISLVELVAVAVTAGLAIGAIALGRPQLREAALAAACVAVVITGLLFVALESAASAIPDSALPATLRRNGIELGAGIGLWIGAGAGLVAVLALADWRFKALGARTWANRMNRQWTLALLALLTTIILLAWLRYWAWFDASASGEHLRLAGWASPWIGPLSLAALWMLIAALGLALLAQTQPAGMVAATAGWLVTFLAALAIVAASSIASLADLAGGALGNSGADFQATLATWTSFAVGLAAAAVGGWLITLPPPVTGD